MSTVSKENYLKTILNQRMTMGNGATTSQMATDLSVSNAAISDMAKKLSKQGLVNYEKYKGMELTSKGEKIALKIIRRHRLWELFLMKVLGLGLSEIHDEAEKLEHYSSDFLIDKIDQFLNYPDFDPHGHPIPKKNGTLPKLPNHIKLSDTEIGNKYEFVSVNDKDSDLINYLVKAGLVLGSKLEVIDKLSFDKSLTVKFNNTELSLSKKITDSVFVILIKKTD
ncbi:MAG TPA: metal-dependent transcriptional regulator [Melioribacteraceae bacterium]|nr:metal-dependent transcriptional regulator [Melioribacteraceae bacterium]